MRISWPIGDVPGNRFRLTVLPITHTRLPLRTSTSVNISPRVMFCQSRTTRNDGDVPLIWSGTQLRLP